MRTLSVLIAALAVSACGGPEVQPLVSTQSPPGTGIVNANSPLQTLNSLPPGAANISSAPGATAPDYLSLGFRAF